MLDQVIQISFFFFSIHNIIRLKNLFFLLMQEITQNNTPFSYEYQISNKNSIEVWKRTFWHLIVRVRKWKAIYPLKVCLQSVITLIWCAASLLLACLLWTVLHKSVYRIAAVPLWGIPAALHSMQSQHGEWRDWVLASFLPEEKFPSRPVTYPVLWNIIVDYVTVPCKL